MTLYVLFQVTASFLMDSLNPVYAEQGSTKREVEVSAMGFFNRYLEEMEGTLVVLLQIFWEL